MAGSHRIQRVPDTEKKGRRHSSEVTVVWMEGRPETAYRLDRTQVRVDTMRGTGPGGQHRNKTDSGVRLLHYPTGIIVTATEDRSQHINRDVAWGRLESKLAEQDRASHHASTNGVRREALDEFRSWTWCGWRDEVKGPGGRRGSMTRALAGRLAPLLKQ